MADQIDRLYKAVLKVKHTNPASSRTALLLRAGRGKIGKEVGEETAEVIIEAIQKHRHASCAEAPTCSTISQCSGPRSKSSRSTYGTR
jgi:phosphoribosyl-ATP pyrophosphohydrolase